MKMHLALSGQWLIMITSPSIAGPVQLLETLVALGWARCISGQARCLTAFQSLTARRLRCFLRGTKARLRMVRRLRLARQLVRRLRMLRRLRLASQLVGRLLLVRRLRLASQLVAATQLKSRLPAAINILRCLQLLPGRRGASQLLRRLRLPAQQKRRFRLAR